MSEPTRPDTDSLLRQLAIKATGANIHTANKAAMYLRKFLKDAKLAGEPSLDKFIELVRGAVYRDEWEPLSSRRAQWW